jgi:lipopolysaccharide export LptBFGC system permease protein LptF
MSLIRPVKGWSILVALLTYVSINQVLPTTKKQNASRRLIMEQVKITMTHKKSTKGTHVYGNEDSAIPSVYIKKEIFGGQTPAEITITVEEKK